MTRVGIVYSAGTSRSLLIFFTGNIASLVVQSQFKKKFGINHLSDTDYADTKGWIVAIATVGAVFGCLGVKAGFSFGETFLTCLHSAPISTTSLDENALCKLLHWSTLGVFSAKDFAMETSADFMYQE